jgi:hypothetical protein
MSTPIVWDEHYLVEERLIVAGTGALSTVLDNAAAVDVGGGLVKVTCTGHGYKVNSEVYIRGSTNYDGLHKLLAVDTNDFTFGWTYAAETFAGTETVGPVVAPGVPFKFGGFKLHLSAASATAENLTATVDSGDGAEYDALVYSKDMNTIQNVIWRISDAEAIPFYNDDDMLVFAWTNTNARTFGLEAFWRRAR